MKKAVYIVTRLIYADNGKQGLAVPNLGVYGNRAAAESHFRKLIAWRMENGGQVQCETHSSQETEGDVFVPHSAMIRTKGRTEELRLEVWRP